MTEKLDASLLERDTDALGLPRISGFSEVGMPGLKVVGINVLEEAEKDFRMPNRIKTVQKMASDSTIAAALQFYTVMLARVPYKVIPPVGATPKQKEQAKFIASCFDDMDTSMFSTLVSILSYLKYGFSVHEKVYKIRKKGKSKYDDGLVGLAGLKPRAQSTLDGWEFSPDGRELTSFVQTIQNIQYGERYSSLFTAPISIPREKFLLFSSMPENGNPEGTSILRGAYTSWKKKQEIEDDEVIGISRDLSGLFMLSVPAAYLDPNADANKKAAADEFKKVLRNVSRGEQSGILLPSDKDEVTKGNLFGAELLSSSGSKNYDTNEIINRWDSRILLSMFADILNVGNNGTGSLALVEGKTELVELGLRYRLEEISDVFNTDLIPQLFRMNGWTDSDYPKFQFVNITKDSLEIVSKFVQRVASVQCIERDREFLNYTREALGLTPFPEDEPPNTELLGDSTSRAGDGMATGTVGNGTAKSVAPTDTSTANQENSS